MLVVVDRLTKFAHFAGLSHPYTAQEVAKVFMDQVVALHGVPKTIISDRDKVFTSHLWRELMKNVGTKLSLSTTYHPQTNGQTERVNQSLETYLRCMCMRQPKSWHWWYNSCHHASTKMTPFEAVYRHRPPPLPATGGQTTATAVEEYLQQRREVLEQLKQELAAA